MRKRGSGTCEEVTTLAVDDRVAAPSPATAVLTGFARSGEPVVDVAGPVPRRSVSARSCVPLSLVDVGKTVVVVVDPGDAAALVVLGVIQPPGQPRAVAVTADGLNLVIRAEHSITLSCGDASITLREDGKVVVRGRHVVSHASGVNRIRGGSVQLN